MTAENRMARAFRLDDEGWARHANPWSGWSRFITCLPLLVLALWSRTWIGPWSAGPVLLALLWIWLNPRAFGPALDDRSWITKGVVGERFWSERGQRPVPERHQTVPHILNLTALAGLPFVVWGVVALDAWPAVLGMVLIIGGKLWYIDRMAILYEDMVQEWPHMRYRQSGPDAPSQTAPVTSES